MLIRIKALKNKKIYKFKQLCDCLLTQRKIREKCFRRYEKYVERGVVNQQQAENEQKLKLVKVLSRGISTVELFTNIF